VGRLCDPQARRDGRQPLELDLPERKILLKSDGTVDRVIVPERLDAHKLIEEFMIQANVAAAETLEGRKQDLVYRVHDAPSLAKQESCANSCRRSACRWPAAPRCDRASSTAFSSASAAPTMKDW
jgi:exoribonuclease R